MAKFAIVGLIGLASVAAGVEAADLDSFRGAPPVVEGLGPPLPYIAHPRPRPPSCRVIAAPQFNLSQDDVAGTRPQVVCLSRGLYSDSVDR